MTIKYPFTRNGVQMFLEDTYEDIMHDLHHKDYDLSERALFITIGDKQIKIEMFAETYEALEELLNHLITIEEE